ncbi:MAG TPA: ABC transporter permease [Candidatus Acidoferrum sp.]|nr:ABC transporter permease [Candidatus Acidoferrum sp.]
MAKLWQDIQYSFRTMRRNPGFALVAILTLAIGIGANVAIFSVVNGVLLEPVPFPHPDRLVLIWETDMNRGVLRGTIAATELLDWRKMNRSFDELSAWRAMFYTITGNGEPEQVWGSQVTGNFFRLLGVSPVLGRDFQADDEQPGHEQVAILSYRFWQGHFGGDPAAIGQTIRVDDKPYTIVGVLPRDFSPYGISSDLDVWTPFAFVRSQLDPEDHELIVFGRMKKGVTLAKAQAEMETILEALKKTHPAFDQKNGIRVVTLQSDLVRRQRPALLLLMAAVGFVLLIACANVANLTLARAADREREIAVRTALGAGRRRILRQLLTESVLLSLIGGTAGVAIAYGGIVALKALVPPPGVGLQMPFLNRVGINVPVLGFTLLISLATGIIFGLAPAVQISRAGVYESLKEGSRGSTGGRRSKMVRSLLVVSEVGLSLMLLAGAGLLIRSFVRMLNEKLGFDPQDLLTMQVYLPVSHYETGPQINNFFQQVITGMSVLPGVQSASAANYLPLTGWSGYCDFDIAGRPHPESGEHFTGQYRVIDWRYIPTMGMSIKEGRDFAESDGPDSEGVVMVTETLARRYWPDHSPIGEEIQLNFKGAINPWSPIPRGGWLRIVGVVGDVRDWQWGEERIGQVFLPSTQDPSRIMRLVAKSKNDPSQLVSAVRSVVHKVDPNQPVTDIRSMDEYLAAALSQRRMSMVLLAIFAVVATLLAAIGIYGVMAYAVAQRTHEIGIRMALGAAPEDMRRMVIMDGMKLAAIGFALGILGSFLAARYVSSQLYGVKSNDPFTFALVLCGLALIALAACYVPAQRATRVDPLVALRHE